MSESTPISIAKLPDNTFTYSLTPFDSGLRGDSIAYPLVTPEQLKVLQVGTQDQVQRVLVSLTNL